MSVRWRRWLVVLCALLIALPLFARVGGGDSYGGGGSSGGGSGSGGGDGGGGELIWLAIRFLFWLTVNYPAIGIPVDIVVIIAVVRWLRKKEAVAAVFNATTKARKEAGETRAAVTTLDGLRRFDPNFSNITFADFCYSLFACAHQARGAKTLVQYAPYMSGSSRQQIASRNPQGLQEVKNIVIGAMRIDAVRGLDTALVTVSVAFEANYTEVAANGEKSWYVRERWTLERQRDILSPPPEKAKADHCPRCGAALKTRTDGSCEFCGAKIESGAFQWYVRSIDLTAKQERGPVLTGGGEEVGTNLPTILQPNVAERLRSIDWAAFESHVRRVAIELQDAWSARDWERVRPLETEGLFQMHRYWIDAYRKQRLRNVVDDFDFAHVEPVKIDSDAFYEAITVRIFAHGRDYTVDENNRIVGGSKNALRSWSEYWTFIRTQSGQRSGKIACPNCGAMVTVGASGICEYCGGKLTSGTFDWILSRIEQDEAYRG